MTKKYLFMLACLFSISIIFAQPSELAIDNGILKVKLDLTRGGAICYVSESAKSNRNLVNIHDEGRYIQQSYYAGNRIDRKAEGQAPRWSPWAWNPVQGGDDFRNRSKILDYKQNGDTLYVKCIPMLWDMSNMPAEAVMEQWSILTGNVLKVHNKLTCLRNDNLYGENILNDQELPAVYPISSMNKLYSYFGSKPFTNDSLVTPEVVNLSSGFWGKYASVTEHWMAFVDDSNWGLGVYNPKCDYFLAGIYGKQGGEAGDSSTSYIAPVRKEILNKNSVYEYEYYVIIGNIDEIRNIVYRLNKEMIIN